VGGENWGTRWVRSRAGLLRSPRDLHFVFATFGALQSLRSFAALLALLGTAFATLGRIPPKEPWNANLKYHGILTPTALLRYHGILTPTVTADQDPLSPGQSPAGPNERINIYIYETGGKEHPPKTKVQCGSISTSTDVALSLLLSTL